MGAALFVGLVILGLVLATWLLQALVLLAQLIVWLGWGVAMLASVAWLAVADRRELARLWREGAGARRLRGCRPATS